MDERWKQVRGHEGMYEVSNLGRVRSLDRTIISKNGRSRRFSGKILSPVLDGSGRLRCRLSGGEFRRVHVMVAEAFIGERPSGMLVCHNDGDPFNNNVTNLRYGTPSANNLDKVKHGTCHETNKTHCPRGHSLTGENLSPSHSAKGTRTCLACDRARAYCRKYGMMDRFKEVADDRYLAILELSTMADAA